MVEAVFMSKYPEAYKYLSLNKMKLAQRDKGEKNYDNNPANHIKESRFIKQSYE